MTRSQQVFRSGRRLAGRVARRGRRLVRDHRLRPALTIIVAVGPESSDHDLRRTLDSLAGQNVKPKRRLEVLISAPQGTLLEAGRAKRVTPASPGPVAALLAGCVAATGDRVAVVAAGDGASEGFASGLLSVNAQVSFAYVADSSDPVATGVTPPPRAKANVSGLQRAMATVLGSAIDAELLRRLPADVVAAPESFLLARVLATRGVKAGFCAPDKRAVYLRTSSARTEHLGMERAAEVIANLDALREPGNDVVTTAAIRAVSEHITNILRTDPERRAEAVRLLGDMDVAWSVINRDLATHLAILYVALPYSDTSANVAARRVRDQGEIVDVITARFHHIKARDRSADPVWARFVDTVFEMPGSANVQGSWESTSRFCRDGTKAIAAAEAHKGVYKSVYSRTMFPASHLLAAQYKLAHPDTPWTAEFSDPQVRDSRGGTRRSTGEADTALLAELAAGMRLHGFEPPAGDSVWEWSEAIAYALADTVLFTNDAQRDYMLGYCPDTSLAQRARTHAEVIVHPSPAAEFYAAAGPPYPLDPNLVHIAYFGTFYPTRTITEVIDAFAQLPADDRNRLRLHVFTTKPDTVREQVEAAGLADVIIVNGYLPFADYLALTTRFDVLLVNDYATIGNHDVNPYLPAKYADYRGSGTAVWGIVEPGSVLSGMPLAHTSELGDVDGARAVLDVLSALR